MAGLEPVFLDTTVLVAGLVDFGDTSESALRVLDAVAEGRVQEVCTAWHCCLEFFSVCTRLPMEFRLSPAEAYFLLHHEILGRLAVVQLSSESREHFLQQASSDGVRGGRIYDAHLAEIARLAGARTVVTENLRHFNHLLREEIRVLAAGQFLALLEET